MKNAETKTQKIAGHEITLTPRQSYLASRPMAKRWRKTYPVWICQMLPSGTWSDEPTLTLPEMTYDQANDFLAAFNNGPSSFQGRVW